MSNFNCTFSSEFIPLLLNLTVYFITSPSFTGSPLLTISCPTCAVISVFILATFDDANPIFLELSFIFFSIAVS